MAHVSAKVLSETLDINGIERSARERWETDIRSRRRFEQWLVGALPIALVVMTVIFYGLSAPHTADILGKITPGLFGGGLSPLAFELGILTVSALRAVGWKHWIAAFIVAVLLFMSILINVAGGFIAVVQGSGLTNEDGGEVDLSRDTVLELLSKYGELPATYQVVLVLVPFVGVIIPVMAMLVGEALVKLALGEIRLARESNDELWAREAAKIMHGALLQAALNAGGGVVTSGKWAESVVDQLYRARRIQVSGGKMLVDGLSETVQTVPEVPTAIYPSTVVSQNGASHAQDSKNGQSAPRLSKDAVKAWLVEHPETAHLDNRAASRAYMRAAFGVDSDQGYKTIERARREMTQGA